MLSYRNPRYAPEPLERKLSPSGGAPPVSALVNTMSPPGADATAMTVLVAAPCPVGRFNSVDYIPYVTLSGDSTSASDPYAGDYLLTDGDTETPPFPGEGPAPIDPPPFEPAGPVVPA